MSDISNRFDLIFDDNAEEYARLKEKKLKELKDKS